MRDKRPGMRFVVPMLAAVAIWFHHVPIARACGCLSPPAVTEGEYAVNQSAEQIIFEVEPGWVTAHVLIRYAGDPAQFAWLVPVPEVPELGVSPASAFGLLDRATAPVTTVQIDNICPQSEWACFFEGQRGGGCTPGPAAAPSSEPGQFATDAASAADAGTAMPPPVEVLGEQTVGDYVTVTFRASEAAAAVQWLRDNGFVVNATTSIYMESYIAENMVFVAAKLVPGAGADAIKPLKLRYRAAFPTVPLIITAVAAQPHLTVTSLIYGDKPFTPMTHSALVPDGAALARDPSGRLNYPMLLARAIDEAGGDGFVIEYSGTSSPSIVGAGSCCGVYDNCGIANDSRCQCPGSPFDALDCAGLPDVTESVELLKALGMKYPTLTRITTRISPEEMTFDPVFAPDFTGAAFGRLVLTSRRPTLESCLEDVIDRETYSALRTRESCAAMYCGLHSECVITASGPACACKDGTVAQQFVDLDGQPSVTCVPRTPTVDLRAGGDALPDSCATVSCGTGTCIDRNGVATCECEANSAATATAAGSPSCAAITARTESPGAQNYSSGYAALEVCAPPPPACPTGAKYLRVESERVGLDCGDATPPQAMQTDGFAGAGCCDASGAPPITFAISVFVIVVLLRRGRYR